MLLLAALHRRAAMASRGGGCVCLAENPCTVCTGHAGAPLPRGMVSLSSAGSRACGIQQHGFSFMIVRHCYASLYRAFLDVQGNAVVRATAAALLSAAEPRAQRAAATLNPKFSAAGDWRLSLGAAGGAGRGDPNPLEDPWGEDLAGAPAGSVPTMEAAAAGPAGGEAGLVPQLDTTLLEVCRFRVYENLPEHNPYTKSV